MNLTEQKSELINNETKDLKKKRDKAADDVNTLAEDTLSKEAPEEPVDQLTSDGDLFHEKLELINNEIKNLRKARDLAADDGDTQAEAMLSEAIDQLTNDYILLNDKSIALIDGSDEMKALLKAFTALEEQLKQQAKDLGNYAQTIDHASILVKGLADIIRIVV